MLKNVVILNLYAKIYLVSNFSMALKCKANIFLICSFERDFFHFKAILFKSAFISFFLLNFFKKYFSNPWKNIKAEFLIYRWLMFIELFNSYVKRSFISLAVCFLLFCCALREIWQVLIWNICRNFQKNLFFNLLFYWITHTNI